MKVVLLAGGKGTRISEEVGYRPKPMIEIGGMPIIWHIMKTYSYYGFNDFVICAGYKQHVIKKWFQDYYIYTSDITYDLTDDDTVFERDVLEKLADEGELMSYSHKGFWRCMDNRREMEELEEYIALGNAPWMVWELNNKR